MEEHLFLHVSEICLFAGALQTENSMDKLHTFFCRLIIVLEIQLSNFQEAYWCNPINRFNTAFHQCQQTNNHISPQLIKREKKYHYI
jgi:hypothetical protein